MTWLFEWLLRLSKTSDPQNHQHDDDDEEEEDEEEEEEWER